MIFADAFFFFLTIILNIKKKKKKTPETLPIGQLELPLNEL